MEQVNAALLYGAGDEDRAFDVAGDSFGGGADEFPLMAQCPLGGSYEEVGVLVAGAVTWCGGCC